MHYCPDSNHIFELIKNETVLGMPNLVDIPYDEPVSFHAGWVTPQMMLRWRKTCITSTLFFEIDGQDYYDPRFHSLEVTYSSTDRNVPNPSIFTGVMTTGWNIGEPHTIRIGLTL